MLLTVLQIVPEPDIRQHRDLNIYFGLLDVPGDIRDKIKICHSALDLCVGVKK